METKSNVVPLTKADSIRTEIKGIAAKATEVDKKKVEEILLHAGHGEFASSVQKFSPAVSAILFLHHNPHNRDWTAEKSIEYARRMRDGEWQRNNATIGFYRDGQLEDGQHRLAGAALAGFEYETATIFGIERGAIITVDVGVKRQPAEAAKLNGIQRAKLKQTITQTVSQYLKKCGDKPEALKSSTQVLNYITENDKTLDTAIEVAETSEQNIADPVLKLATSAAFTFLMVKQGWEPQKIQEKLTSFQMGVSFSGEKTPAFVAAEVIKASRAKRDRRDTLNGLKEIAIVVYAMVQSELGVTSVTSSKLLNAVKQKMLPKPDYPSSGEVRSAA